MKKYYYIWPLFIIIGVFFMVTSQTTYILADQEKTETGISFGQFVEVDKQKPALYEVKPTTYPSTNAALPRLGQLMTSFILLLLGVGCMIVFLGVISLRKVYSMDV